MVLWHHVLSLQPLLVLCEPCAEAVAGKGRHAKQAWHWLVRPRRCHASASGVAAARPVERASHRRVRRHYLAGPRGWRRAATKRRDPWVRQGLSAVVEAVAQEARQEATCRGEGSARLGTTPPRGAGAPPRGRRPVVEVVVRQNPTSPRRSLAAARFPTSPRHPVAAARRARKVGGGRRGVRLWGRGVQAREGGP